MPYIHAGTTREHSDIKALPEHCNQFRWCSDCRCWYYRHDDDKKINFAENQRRLDESPTNEMIAAKALEHVAYGWAPSPNGNWTDAQKQLYSEAFNAAKNRH
jgi:hypothetical protein